MTEDTQAPKSSAPKGRAGELPGLAVGAVFGVVVGLYVAQRAVVENGNSWFGAGLIGVLLGAACFVVGWKFVGALRSFLSGEFIDDVERLTRENRDRDKARLAAATAKRQAAVAASAAARAAAPARAAPAAAPAPAAPAAPEGARPQGLDEPRDGGRDDLKALRGVGPKLEATLNAAGLWHYDQIAALTPAEVAWLDANLDGVRGRAGREDWPGQARALMEGGAAGA